MIAASLQGTVVRLNDSGFQDCGAGEWPSKNEALSAEKRLADSVFLDLSRYGVP